MYITNKLKANRLGYKSFVAVPWIRTKTSPPTPYMAF